MEEIICTDVFEEEASDDMQTDRMIPVEDTDPDQMDTLEDDILSDQMDTSDDDMQSDQMDSLEEGKVKRHPVTSATVAVVRIDDERAGPDSHVVR
jgi:hypothetical protein